MFLQSVVCVSTSEEVEVLGLAHQKVWSRNHPPRRKTEKRGDRAAREKESEVWAQVLEAIGPAPASGPAWVSVGDRESDVFVYLRRARALGWHCLLRARHNRRTKDEEGVPGLLLDQMRTLESRTSFSLTLRARPDHPARQTLLNVAWMPVTLQVPKYEKGASPIPVWGVRVWEDAAEGLEWILLSTLKVETEEEALEKAEWYRRRWLIEEYHKCLKTGCSMEDRQLTTRHGLEALLGFLSIVAVYLLQLKTFSEVEFPPDCLEALNALTQKDWSHSTPKEILREVAKLGGFLARKSDGDPGWMTIWRGWTRLLDIAIGFRMGRP